MQGRPYHNIPVVNSDRRYNCSYGPGRCQGRRIGRQYRCQIQWRLRSYLPEGEIPLLKLVTFITLSSLQRARHFKGIHNIFPKVPCPPCATSCENMASHCERTLEKTQKFQIVYTGRTNFWQHSTTDLARDIMTTKRKQKTTALSTAQSFKHSKTTSSFLYSIYPTNEEVKVVSST